MPSTGWSPTLKISTLPEGYAEFLRDIKARIQSSQSSTALAVNRELLALYWEIGRAIVEHQEAAGWGKNVVEALSHDLKREFPGTTGFSARNLWDMRRFYAAYRDDPNLRQLVAGIPWGHNLLLLNSVKDPARRAWYAAQTLEHGWSRAVLTYQIESDLYARQIEAPKASNFASTLPPPQSDLVAQMQKDPYVLDKIRLWQIGRAHV